MKKIEKAKKFLTNLFFKAPRKKTKHFRVHGRIHLKKYIQIWSVIWNCTNLIKIHHAFVFVSQFEHSDFDQRYPL